MRVRQIFALSFDGWFGRRGAYEKGRGRRVVDIVIAVPYQSPLVHVP